jgi:paraquat-inducible protein A
MSVGMVRRVTCVVWARFMEPTATISSATGPAASRLTCGNCGQIHRGVALAPGEKARCVRCNTLLAKGSRFGVDTALACAVAGLVLAVPATLLPFVTVSKLANERVGLLFTGVGTLWHDGMRLLAVWVFVCGGLVPALLLATLIGLAVPGRFGVEPLAPRTLRFLARSLEHWAMPEVQVLAVLVALVKLHTLVNVQVGPGFYCYAGMALLTLCAWRSFENDHAAPGAIHSAAEPCLS